MSKTWKPVLRAVDPRALRLSPVEGFLLSRIDGRTSVGELALLTAQSEAQVAAALERLVAQGAVVPSFDGPAAPEPAARAPMRAGAGGPTITAPEFESPKEPPPGPSVGTRAQMAGAQMAGAQMAGAQMAGAQTSEVQTSEVQTSEVQTSEVQTSEVQTSEVQASELQTSEVHRPQASEPHEAQTSDAAGDDQGAPPDDSGLDATEDAEAAAHAPTHLALYQERFHGLPPGERVQLASTATGAVLAALCFDPLPSVVRAILENPNASLAHGRLIATHHRNAAGLEHLLAHGALLRDAQVQRLLWRNPQLNEGQLRRLTASKRLLALWKLAVSREATAQTRAATAKLVRARFAVASAEERVELILSTEGRALAGLSGLPVDGRTTSMLCAKSYASLLLVQNLAKWSVAPGPLIAHLLRQPLVARAPQLKALLLRHPNAPSKSG